METKTVLRKMIYKKRAALSAEEIADESGKICRKVIALPAFLEADTVYTYIGFRGEVDTRQIIEEAWQLNKTVAVPKVVGWNLTFCELESFEQLTAGYFNIPEPEGCPEAESETAFMVMPGVAFDERCNRIGYGQSFYDRYLKKHVKHPTAALAFDFQIIPEGVPSEETDVRPDILLTQTRMFEKKGDDSNPNA